ncbi:TetR/AcrR family transcriptional regulator [Brachybacterium sp. NPDC056505]|uniref:TetR/AcrR family transcriptional regulator n=1 Tax=Brachybacterium sp. NPDC056505 TaxID=3345843 RepID=UPI003670603F
MIESSGDRPYHHGNLRVALLEAAESRLAQSGVEAITLRDLAREIGVSHAAPRRHFAGRQALLDALAISGFTRLDADLHRAMAATAGDFPSRLRAVAATYTRFATENASLLELMYASKHRPGAEGIVEAAEKPFSMLFELMRQGQSEGALSSEDPTDIATVLFATLQGIATMINGGFVPSAQLQVLTDTAVTQFLRGARP